MGSDSNPTFKLNYLRRPALHTLALPLDLHPISLFYALWRHPHPHFFLLLYNACFSAFFILPPIYKHTLLSSFFLIFSPSLVLLYNLLGNIPKPLCSSAKDHLSLFIYTHTCSSCIHSSYIFVQKTYVCDSFSFSSTHSMFS